MTFDPGVSKQAQEVVFSRKAIANNHSIVYFNSVPIIRKNFQKHVGLFLDSKLHFFDYIKKATKAFNAITKMNLSFLRSFFLTICKSFVRPYLDDGDVIHDQPNNYGLSDKIESACSTTLC